jgi:hypothetical protein
MAQRRQVTAVAVIAGVLSLAGCSSKALDAGKSAASASSALPTLPTLPPAGPVGSTTTVTVAPGVDPGITKFCVDSQHLADYTAQQAKDIAGGVAVATPEYMSKSAEQLLPLLLDMQTDAPADVLPTVSDYFGAYADYVAELQKVGFVIPPADAAGRQIVQDATHAYGPKATADLPQIETYVKTTCGIELGLGAGK